MDMIKKRAAMRGQSGFTLVELLVAVAILAVLAGVAVFAVGGLTSGAGANACKTERDTILTAINTSRAQTPNNVNPGTYIQGGTGSLKYFQTPTSNAVAPANPTATNTWTVNRKTGTGPGTVGDVPEPDCQNITGA